ncbi:hypothetical protein BH20CHL4_BH20CHL4_13000 [soil metagenome]
MSSFDATLAINGGTPVRTTPLPGHNRQMGQKERDELAEVINSGQLGRHGSTKVKELARAFAELYGVKHAIAVISGSAAVHTAGGAPHPRLDPANRVADQPNIVIEFCSTYLAAGAIQRGIEAVGAERVLFGSDFPLIALTYMRAAYVDAELSPDEAASISIRNAMRLFPALLEERVPA